MKMMQFASTFSENEILLQLVTKIAWSSIIQIMAKSSSKEEMLWYINRTYENKWSRRMVVEQFRCKSYERKIIEPLVTESVAKYKMLEDLPEYLLERMKEIE